MFSLQHVQWNDVSDSGYKVRMRMVQKQWDGNSYNPHVCKVNFIAPPNHDSPKDCSIYTSVYHPVDEAHLGGAWVKWGETCTGGYSSTFSPLSGLQ